MEVAKPDYFNLFQAPERRLKKMLNPQRALTKLKSNGYSLKTPITSYNVLSTPIPLNLNPQNSILKFSKD